MALLGQAVLWDRNCEKAAKSKLAELKENGFVRARVDGTIYRLEDVPALVRYEKHTIEAVIDRLSLERKNMSRLHEALEGALKLTDGKLVSFLLSAPGAGAGNAGAGNAPAKERKSVPPAMAPSDLDILPRMRR